MEDAVAGVMDDLLGQLGRAGGGGGAGDLLGSLLGGQSNDSEGAAKTERAAGLGMEALLSGLARNAESRQGARSITKALKAHDGAVLDDIPQALGSSRNAADGEKIVNHIFGDNTDQIAQSVAEKSGLDLSSVTTLLPMLAPLVMGALAKKTGGKGAGALPGALRQETSGFDLGDLVGMLGAGTGSGKGSGLGALGGLLGGLFGKKR
ncbi:MAG: DUF937 domain-containing protein [Actinomycetota bacterium]